MCSHPEARIREQKEDRRVFLLLVLSTWRPSYICCTKAAVGLEPFQTQRSANPYALQLNTTPPPPHTLLQLYLFTHNATGWECTGENSRAFPVMSESVCGVQFTLRSSPYSSLYKSRAGTGRRTLHTDPLNHAELLRLYEIFCTFIPVDIRFEQLHNYVKLKLFTS